MSSICGIMVKREMLKSTKEFKPGTHVKSFHYSTIGKHFELKPMPKPVVVKVNLEPEIILPPVVATPAERAQMLANTLTVLEAHELYKLLGSMFRKE